MSTGSNRVASRVARSECFQKIGFGLPVEPDVWLMQSVSSEACSNDLL